MEFKEQEIQSLVQEILKRLETGSVRPGAGPSAPSAPAAGTNPCVFSSIDDAVSAAEKAQAVFQDMGMDFRRKLIEAMREAARRNAEKLSRLACEETGMGRVEDKIVKNVLIADKTPGVEDLQPVSAFTGDNGLTLVEYAPFGVVAAVAPSTNPSSTIVNNSICILSGGNSVVFAPHPAAKKCCQETMRLLDEAIRSVGGPAGLITTFEPISQEGTKALLSHPRIRCSVVTGGPAIVKVAMGAGKPQKLICAGPGNPPVIVDEYADFSRCARDIISGASFDNCVLCTGEKEVIVTAAAWDKFLPAMRQDPRAHELTTAQMDELCKKIILESGKGGREPKVNRDYIGKNANVIAQKGLGLNLPESVRLLWGVVPNDHDFIWTEQLMPLLPVTQARDFDAALSLAKQAEGGNNHTASIYSLHVGNLTRAARTMACSIFVKNGSNFMGLGRGEGYATVSIGTPTGDGLTKPRHFVRPLHCSLVGYFRIA
ncbi:MAG TPA: aldehyde dehydrogenase [Elusimicrobiota bacterium]|nr:aldehyde dehydrogenase [Elusimicrobiota bacterium]